ncbi:MAG: 30S ribosomal protein S8 [Bacteroidetes bacterium]|nr:30S ribosomal protein S8 [Bacteroidota bacterium]
MIIDPISDYLTRIRNAQQAGHRIVEIPASKTKKKITEILYDHGYILKYKFEDSENNQGVIKIALKFDSNTKEPVIKNLKRVSTPGLRQYRGHEELPRVLSGLGIAIISTSKGLMTDKQARTQGIGGEVLCEIF